MQLSTAGPSSHNTRGEVTHGRWQPHRVVERPQGRIGGRLPRAPVAGPSSYDGQGLGQV